MPDRILGKPTLPHGAYSQIARRLRPKVTPNHVREVDLGNRKSRRVEDALARYRARMTEQVEQGDEMPQQMAA